MAHSITIGDRDSMLTCLTDVPPGLQEHVIINVHHVPSMMSDRAGVQKELMNKWNKKYQPIMKPTFSHIFILSASVYANFLFCKDKYAAPFKTWGEKQ